MKVLEIAEYPFQRVELNWHGPFTWNEDKGRPDAGADLLSERGVYRAETAGQNRKLIKYIGSATTSFSTRFNNHHRIKTQLVNGQFRKARVYLATIHPESNIIISQRNVVEIEYILQNVHYWDLISWHGLGKLPKTSRGEGWHIVNLGSRGTLYRVIHYPSFAVSGQDR